MHNYRDVAEMAKGGGSEAAPTLPDFPSPAAFISTRWNLTGRGAGVGVNVIGDHADDPNPGLVTGSAMQPRGRHEREPGLGERTGGAVGRVDLVQEVLAQVIPVAGSDHL